jgi:Flp pilus assembly protein TadD
MKRTVKIVDIDRLRGRAPGSLSCCIITRDEQDLIARAIDSVRDLADEVIVVDTGSIDRTVQVAAGCGARVFETGWGGDFSEARNVSLERATKEWILVLDADEEIAREDHERIRDLIDQYPDGAFLFDQLTYLHSGGGFGWRELETETTMSRGASGCFRSRQIRLFRNDRSIRYSGEVCESVLDQLASAGIATREAGIAVHHYGRLERAERVYRKALAYPSPGLNPSCIGPDDTMYLAELAAQLIQMGRTPEAIDCAQAGLEAQQENWELHNVLGLAFMRFGRKYEAESSFRMAVGISTNDPDLRNNLGVSLMDQNKHTDAYRAFVQGAALDGADANLFRNAAVAGLALGEVDSAAGFIERALDMDPFAPGTHAIHADVLLRQGDSDAAAEALEKIRFLSGTPLRVYLKAIHLLTQMKRIADAEEVLGRALADYPDFKGFQFLLGKLAELKGDDDGAAAIFRKLLAVQPEDADLHNSLGCIYERKGDLQKALEAFREAARLSPGDPQLEVNLGITLGKLGWSAEAESVLRDVVEKNADYGAAFHALGCNLAGAGRYLESLRFFARAVELEPGNPGFYLNFGLACEKANLPGRAAEVYEKMALVDPSTASRAKERLQKLCRPV